MKGILLYVIPSIPLERVFKCRAWVGPSRSECILSVKSSSVFLVASICLWLWDASTYSILSVSTAL